MMNEQLAAEKNLWAIVLAAGRGTRLAAVTRTLCGRELPKQFVALTSTRTLLQETMDRIAPLIPPERTVVVTSDAHYDLCVSQLRGYKGVEIVRQPLDRGTGPGVMLPLAHVLARDPRARVAVFPSDHHVQRPNAFLTAIRRALLAGARSPSGIALLGVPAERPATDLGWIVPGERISETAARVQQFVEKPGAEAALTLLQAGGLWNTMVVAGSAAALWHLGRRNMPEQTRCFEKYLGCIDHPAASAALASLYAEMVPADFSRNVLQVSVGLAVVAVVDSGWFDCGTPERLLEWLAATADPPGILASLRRAGAVAPSDRSRAELGAAAVA
jgi:mannose-1-phosphate guanylyltransferase